MVSNIGKTRGTPSLTSSDFQSCNASNFYQESSLLFMLIGEQKKDAYFMPVACYDSRRSSFPSISSFFLSLRPILPSLSFFFLLFFTIPRFCVSLFIHRTRFSTEWKCL